MEVKPHDITGTALGEMAEKALPTDRSIGSNGQRAAARRANGRNRGDIVIGAVAVGYQDPAHAQPPPRRVLILGAAPCQLLNIAGPAEILTQAGQLMGHRKGPNAVDGRAPLYSVSCLIVSEPNSPATTAGLTVQSTVTEADVLGLG